MLAAHRLNLLAPAARSFNAHEDALSAFAVIAALALGLYFHEDHFVLLLVITVMLTTVATLGLNIQFGYAGVLNFAGSNTVLHTSSTLRVNRFSWSTPDGYAEGRLGR